MSLHAFKSVKNRRHEAWSPDEAERFGRLAQFLNEKHIAAYMRCAQPRCPDRTLKPVEEADRMILRCGCMDRALADVGDARG